MEDHIIWTLEINPLSGSGERNQCNICLVVWTFLSVCLSVQSHFIKWLEFFGFSTQMQKSPDLIVFVWWNAATSFERSQLQLLFPFLQNTLPSTLSTVAPLLLSFTLGDPLKFAQGRVNNNASILQKAEQLYTSLLALFPLLPVSFLSVFSLCHNKNPFFWQIWVKFKVLGFIVSIVTKWGEEFCEALRKNTTIGIYKCCNSMLTNFSGE